MHSPLLSICCITYNHVEFIADAIDGFLLQKTDFPFEIVIHDDASTDGTSAIVQYYAAKYPYLIRATIHPANIGMMQNFMGCIKDSRGEYVAYCEGDDFWTDSQKLQIQVDALQNNIDYSMTFHGAYHFWDKPVVPQAGYPFTGSRVKFIDLLRHYNFITTATVVFRNIKDFPVWFDKMPIADFPLYFLLSRDGDFFFVDRLMANYRVNEQGAWTGISQVKRMTIFKTIYERLIPLADSAEKVLMIDQILKYNEYIAAHRFPHNPLKRVVVRNVLQLKHYMKYRLGWLSGWFGNYREIKN